MNFSARLQGLRWPLPALLAWACAWGLFALLRRGGVGEVAALVLASSFGMAWSVLTERWWRRLLIGLGFPLSLALSGVVSLPAWAWLLPLALLLLIYPLKAWRDAPLFPTPPDVLNDLPDLAPLPPGARVLDAGCGLGHGLEALRQAYPLARLHGIEWSRPLRWLCARRCPWAEVRQGDIWQEDWSGYDLVYLFQRPESMPHAMKKARAELKPGAWLVSLEFEVPGLPPTARLEDELSKPVWLYRALF
jgi:SAM-dependent methyltransferase